MWARYQKTAGLECCYEYVIEQLELELDAERQHARAVETENQQLRAELQASHRRLARGPWRARATRGTAQAQAALYRHPLPGEKTAQKPSST